MSAPTPRPLALPAGLAFGDLYSAGGAARVDALFVAHLREADAALADRLMQARAEPDALERKAESELLIALAPHVEDFLAALFGIVAETRALEARHHELAPLYSVKRLFVQRRAMNAHKPEAAAAFDGAALRRTVETAMGEPLTELAFANAVTRWQQDEDAHGAALDAATRYAAWAAHTPAGRAVHRGGLLFRAPRKLDHLQLVALEAVHIDGVTAWKHPGDHLRRREGFALTDPGMDLPAALGEAHYCIWCHEQGKDSCARGLPEKKPADGDPQPIPFRRSPFG
ncbi:MAG TPA: hypothetical protein VFN38_04405, partial [Gemmatimonadaceae bacterium]|nr:hypothetical protein [Gemmatimonadaceae bacterium]